MTTKQTLETWLGSLRQTAIPAITLVNVAVALFGFARDVSLTSYLGTSQTADAFSLTYFIVDTIGNIIFSATIALLAVPTLARTWIQSGFVSMESKMRQMVGIGLGVSAIMVASLFFGGNWLLVSMGGPGLGMAAYPLYLLLLPNILLYPLIGVTTAALQVAESYIASLFPVLLQSSIVLLGVLLLGHEKVAIQTGGHFIPILVLGGTVGQATLLWIFWRKKRPLLAANGGQTVSSGLAGEGPDPRRYFFWYALALTAPQTVSFIERTLASHQSTGTVAGLTYAIRICQLPTWLSVATITIFAYPIMAKAHAAGEPDKIRQLFRQASMSMMAFTLPTMFFFYVFREPLVALFFQRGHFNLESTQITAILLSGYAWTILGRSFTLFVLRYFLSTNVIIAPVLLTFAASAINIILDYAFLPIWGTVGLGMAASLTTTAGAIALLFLLEKNLKMGILRGWKPVLGVMALEVCFFGAMELVQGTFGQGWVHWNPLELGAWLGINILVFGALHTGGLTGWRILHQSHRRTPQP